MPRRPCGWAPAGMTPRRSPRTSCARCNPSCRPTTARATASTAARSTSTPSVLPGPESGTLAEGGDEGLGDDPHRPAGDLAGPAEPRERVLLAQPLPGHEEPLRPLDDLAGG